MNDDTEINPWDVYNVEEFLYFCCPECDEKNQSKDMFINHALSQHPRAKQSFGILRVKQEIVEQEEYESKNNINNGDNNSHMYYEDTDHIENFDYKVKAEELCEVTLNVDKSNNENYEAEGEFSCSLCEKSFQFESILQKHLKIDHETLSDDQIQKCWIVKTYEQFMFISPSYLPHKNILK